MIKQCHKACDNKCCWAVVAESAQGLVGLCQVLVCSRVEGFIPEDHDVSGEKWVLQFSAMQEGMESRQRGELAGGVD